MIKKKWFTVSNLITVGLFVFAAAMLLSPQVKAWTIQNLMKIGLFQPRIENYDQNVLKDNATAGLLPGVRFVDENGQTTDLANLKGKVVFINFWATWCPPCIAEMPSINELHKKFRGNEHVIFLMVDVDKDYNKSDKFMKKRGYEMKVFNPASQIPPAFMQGTIPTTVILDKNGNISYRQEGAADYSGKEIFELIDKLSNQIQ